MTYVKTGPFVTGGVPGINAPFLNAMETALANSFIVGNVARIACGFASVVTTGTIITHGLGALPSAVFATVSGVGVTTVASIDSTTITTTTMKVSSSVNANIWWIALVVN